MLLLERAGYQIFVPALKRSLPSGDYFIPCGPQVDLGRVQPIAPEDCLALIPLVPAERFMLQHDLNVFACHSDRYAELCSEFKEA